MFLKLPTLEGASKLTPGVWLLDVCLGSPRCISPALLRVSEIVRVIVNDDEGDADVADDSDDVVGDC